MPFTPAHPAIVLPLLRRTRRWLSASGLIVGSMAPDLEYFFRLRPGGGVGHTLLGVLWLDLPLSLLIIGLFHGIVKKPLIFSLPDSFRLRLEWFAKQPWPLRNLWSPRLLLGILVGCASHLVWDTFTHQRGRFESELQILSYQFANITLRAWLQNGSSVVGLAVIAWYVWNLPITRKVPDVSSRVRRNFWGLCAVLTLLFWAAFLYAAHLAYPLLMKSAFDGIFIVTGMSAMMAALLVTCPLWPYIHTARSVGEPAGS
ncbi:DUF4184 family protein [Hymenobacter sp. GOD-10R]|uniref:DUF4184 family protein n=1 Tax=Hymenobacter sp. GOD-10R TaxID=3093922 RepID=UPI002D777ED4|nr:DUF4184 family protein [Hymenobacter sp. GOD-10R]WRQ29651.1 DUF4184 family protein [Hymenobacter sp. GOD-10R]